MQRMNRNPLMLSVVALFLFAAVAQAGPISGSIAFGSSLPFSLSGGAGLTTNTGFIFLSGPNAIVSATGGDFASVAFGTGVTFYSFTFDPASAIVGTLLWDFTSGGKTYSLTGQSVSIFSRSSNSITLEGTGNLFITGGSFGLTPGGWTFTANQNGTSVSFSSSANSLPEPTLIHLLGLGLGAVILLAWRWKT